MIMAQEKNLAEEKQKPKANKDWIWWTLVAVFIVASIGGMMVIDGLYAPGAYNPATLPDAVGK
jgi:hypothetical protein